MPTGARTALSYLAIPDPDTVCTVNGSTGALTLVGAGECVVTATAEGTDNYNEADTSYTVTVQATGTLVLNLVEPIATDNVINAAEKKLGFKISGDTGAVGGVGVTVTVGGTDLPATSADADPATWSVSVPADASDITGTSLALRVSAAKTGYDLAERGCRAPPEGGPDRADGAELHGAVVAAGGGRDHGDESVGRQRHRRVRCHGVCRRG